MILGLRAANFKCHICVTGQHREMLDQILDSFDLQPEADLAIMTPNQSLASLTAKLVQSVDEYIAIAEPAGVLVQGDTTTVLSTALAAFYRKTPLGHVEAGLRTGNLESPWPEEANRVLTSRLSSIHFAPTALNRANLLREGVPAESIVVTGNTGIDALFLARDRVLRERTPVPQMPPELLDSPARIVLITGHRRESFGRGFESICAAIAALARSFPEVHFVYPVHLNPRVRDPVRKMLGQGARNVHLIEPLSYLPFVALMLRATLILTDSGGIQEEAPSLGKPVLVMRDTTERPEGIDAGTVRLVGTQTERITTAVAELLTDEGIFARMSSAHNPYGDGKAAGRIVAKCREVFG